MAAAGASDEVGESVAGVVEPAESCEDDCDDSVAGLVEPTESTAVVAAMTTPATTTPATTRCSRRSTRRQRRREGRRRDWYGTSAWFPLRDLVTYATLERIKSICQEISIYNTEIGHYHRSSARVQTSDGGVMKLANHGGRLVLVVDDGIVDVADASGGRFSSDPQSIYERWDELRSPGRPRRRRPRPLDPPRSRRRCPAPGRCSPSA